MTEAVACLARQASSSDREHWTPCRDTELTLTIVVAGALHQLFIFLVAWFAVARRSVHLPLFHRPLSSYILSLAGASGDLARKKTYPSLQFLFCNGFLPRHTAIIGYGRSHMTDDALRNRLRPTLTAGDGSSCSVDAFLSICTYVSGAYEGPEGFQGLESAITGHESGRIGKPAGRLYYLALPPSVYPTVCAGLKKYCDDVPSDVPGSWIRVIVEKPFGRDVFSSEELADQLGALYPESQLYRIDHYLGKEMLQSLFVMRFANALLSHVWSRDTVAAVLITFKEDFGTQGRGGYFDQFGIIRDMIATHLSQILAFVAMEKPASSHPDDIRDEKLKLLRCVLPAEASQCVLGQYEGYLDDETVPKGSTTATYAAITVFIDNDRWAGVPFIIRAGKALNERKTEVRLQLHATPKFIFEGNAEQMRNEMVIRLQPDEAIYLKFLLKKPGLDIQPTISELDLDYRRRYPGVVIPDAYSRLILECLRGDQQHFLRRDELRAAWAVFTPLLQEIDAGRLPVHQYAFGSRGPPQADELVAAAGYIRPKDYKWEAKHALGTGHMSAIAE